MRVLNGSLLKQPKNLFTLDAYRDILKQYQMIRYEQENISYQTPEHRKRVESLWEQRWKLLAEYRSRLPVYLLARCPFCGGRVWEPIDTFSLNGMGWTRTRNGFGWYGMVPTTSSERANQIQEAPSYESDCDHVRVVAVDINLNCLMPDDVYQVIEIGSERPFVMTSLMKAENSYAVLHTLPISRFDDLEPQPHYTAYFVTYFTIDEATYDNVMQNAYETMSLVIHSIADYDLAKWVDAGKLYWLDKEDPNLPLSDMQVKNFPYGDMKGYEGKCEIFEGRLRYLGRHPGDNLCEDAELKKGFWRQMISVIRGN